MIAPHVALLALLALAFPASADRNSDGKLVIACLGDSNTASNWQHERPGGFPDGEGWCELLVRRFEDVDVTSLNLGAPGGTAVDHFLRDIPADRLFFDGAGQLDYALGESDADVVLLAFGTNDVLVEHKASPERVVAMYRRLADRAASRGLVVMVAKSPDAIVKGPQVVVRRPAGPINDINRLLEEAFPREVLLDFNTIVTPDDYMDGLHMNASGQAGRAEEAYTKLRTRLAALPPPAGIRALAWHDGRWSPAEPSAR